MKSFLQSDIWADFQKSLNRKTWRVDEVLVIKHNLPLNRNYLYSPHPYFLNFGGQSHFGEWLEKIRRIAKKENAIFLKLEFKDSVNKEMLKKFKFKKSTNIQFQKTIILDISQPEQELLKQMHQKTRYNIRLAEKKEIEIKKGKKYFEDFWKLLKDTAKKGGFHTHLKEHYRKMLNIPGVEIFIAIYNKKIIAANIVMFYKETAIYLHGASDYQYRNLMAPHLLQWHQILEAKKQGCSEYDFWGIDEKKWPGLTRFKRGFAPQARSALRGPVGPKARGSKEIVYPGAYDLVFQSLWYKIYKLAKIFK